MDILGIGGWELAAIIIIMLIVAGPKRMIAWSYTLGKYVAMLRKMWGEAARSIQKEFDQAGVDIQVPKDLPTRAALTKEVGRFVQNAGQPLKAPLQEVTDEIKGVRESLNVSDEVAAATGANGSAKPARAYAPSLPPRKSTPALAENGTAVETVEAGSMLLPPQPHKLATMGRIGSVNGAANGAANGNGANGHPAPPAPAAPATPAANPDSFGTWGN